MRKTVVITAKVKVRVDLDAFAAEYGESVTREELQREIQTDVTEQAKRAYSGVQHVYEVEE